MKKLNKFLNEASFLTMFMIGFIFMFALLYLGSIALSVTMEQIMLCKMIAVISVLVGLMFGLTNSLCKTSMKFWEGAKLLEAKIEETNDKAGLSELYENDYKKLTKLASPGSIHTTELTKLYTTLKVKYKYVN